MRSSVIWNLKPCLQVERSPTGNVWMDLFDQMLVISHNPLSLLGQVEHGTNVG